MIQKDRKSIKMTKNNGLKNCVEMESNNGLKINAIDKTSQKNR